MNTSIAIYSHKTRARVLDETVERLRSVGIEPDVISVQDAPPNQIANRKNAHTALVKAFAGNNVLVLEDDIIPNEFLVEWIEWLEATSLDVTTLYACVGKFYTREVRPFVDDGVQVPEHLHGLYELQGLRGWYGAQAVWIPEDWCESIIATTEFRSDEHAPYGPWDHALRYHLQDECSQMQVVVPNIVQHAAPPSVVNRSGPRHTSPIFSVAARPPRKE